MQASTFGIILVVCTLLGALIGYWLDRFLGTAPFFILVGLFAGASFGFSQIIREAKKMNCDISAQDASQSTQDNRN